MRKNPAMSKKLDQLRAAIADESIPLTERRTAAEHLVTAVVDAVPEPEEDNAEVVELLTPWTDDGTLGSIAPMAWKQRNLVYDWHESGPSLAQARKHVHDRLRFRALLAVVVDESAHRLTRLEACRVILDEHLHPQGYHRKNNYNAEKLLEKILPPDAMKWTASGKVPVVRPPMTLADVW
jgi:hypothetical protein